MITGRDLCAGVLAFYERLDHTRTIPADLCCTDMTTYVSGGDGLGLESCNALGAVFYAAFPDLRHRIAELFAGERHVVSRLHITGTHSGPLGALAPTGKRISLSSLVVHVFNETLIQSRWIETDQLGLYQQIGAIRELKVAHDI